MRENNESRTKMIRNEKSNKRDAENFSVKYRDVLKYRREEKKY